MAIIGIDLGGTKVAGAIFNKNGDMLHKEVQLLNGRTGLAVGELIAEVIDTLITTDSDIIAIDSIGICIPGIVYSRTGNVWAPNIPGWEEFPLKKLIEESVRDKSITIALESDRTCYILGEVWKGAARGCDNAIYLAVGTGIGAGILIDGRIIHGANDIVGATGWMALQNPYVDDYIPCGCFEHYASGNGIGLQARKLLTAAGSDYRGAMSGKPVEEITSHDVFAAYRENDPIAVQVLDKAIEMWGMGTANLVSLFNPEKIIFGGGVFGPAAQFIDRIYAEACKWGQPISMKDVKFEASSIDGEAALMGAAHLALRALLRY